MADDVKQEVAQEQQIDNSALEAKIAELTDALRKQKAATDNASADASEWKKKYRDTQSEQERNAAEQAEKQAAMQAQLEEYQAKDRVNSYKAKLLEIGYDAESASKMASTLPAGISDDFFETQKQFMETRTKAIQAAALQVQPELKAGQPLQTNMLEDKDVAAFRKAAGLN